MLQIEPKPLSRRELDVALMAEGLSNKLIAVRLFISEFTVHFHVGNVRRKLGRHTHAGAACEAVRRGLCP